LREDRQIDRCVVRLQQGQVRMGQARDSCLQCR
jgi:hypothetical protein